MSLSFRYSSYIQAILVSTLSIFYSNYSKGQNLQLVQSQIRIWATYSAGSLVWNILYTSTRADQAVSSNISTMLAVTSLFAVKSIPNPDSARVKKWTILLWLSSTANWLHLFQSSNHASLRPTSAQVCMIPQLAPFYIPLLALLVDRFRAQDFITYCLSFGAYLLFSVACIESNTSQLQIKLSQWPLFSNWLFPLFSLLFPYIERGDFGVLFQSSSGVQKEDEGYQASKDDSSTDLEYSPMVHPKDGIWIDPSKIYALIIGNNDYPNKNDWWSLDGAEQDAKSFRKFLLKRVGVPEFQVRLLINSKRASLISALKELKEGRFRRNSDSIDLPNGSAFVLFYAGHGGRTLAPKAWRDYHTPDGQVEQLIPSNIGEIDESGKVVQGIPDRTIAAVLKGLANKIGDNITVIFDCCHSAGQTRAPQPDSLTKPLLPRCLQKLPPITDDCDADIVTGMNIEVGLTRGPRGGMRSSDHSDPTAQYILLAACQQDQYAFDSDSGGLFTTRLLSILKREDLNTLTYAGIMLRLEMPDQFQSPACFGMHQNRVIFSTKEGARTDDCFIGEIRPRNAQSAGDASIEHFALVYGGKAHGIQKGDNFRIFDITPEQNFLGEGEVTESFATCSKLSVSPAIHSLPRTTVYCRLVQNYSSLTVFCDTSEKNLLSNVNTEKVKFGEAASREDAMAILEDDKRYRSCIRVSFVPRSGAPYSRFGSPILKREASEIREVLTSTYRIRSLLDSPNYIPRGWENVDVCFVKVQKVTMPGVQASDPIESGWARTADLWCHSFKEQGDTMTIRTRKRSQHVKEREKDHYGLLIKNGSTKYLFAYVLCLDSEELRIDPWYSSTYFTPDIPFYQEVESEQPRVAAGIKPGEHLTIGYGSSGVDPFKFVIADSLAEDWTFFKIILTIAPTDFSMLHQPYNPLYPPVALDAAMTRSSTARTRDGVMYDRRKAVVYAKEKEWDIKSDAEYFSVNLAVRQVPL